MKICMFNDHRLGVVEGNEVLDVTDVLNVLPTSHYPFPTYDVLIANLDRLRAPIALARNHAAHFALDSVVLRSPVSNPGKLIAAPVNYQAHLDEAIADTETFSRAHVRKIQETGLFLKATSSLVGAGGSIVLGLPERRTDHEIELAVIIGREARNVSVADALGVVAGYTIGLDITIRGPEERSLRKSLDSYSVLGPWIVTADEMGDPHDLSLALDVNGEARQRANTRDLIMNVSDLIAFASSFYTLYPGDVLFSGTPEGVGPIHGGDTIHARIDRIGAFSIGVSQ